MQEFCLHQLLKHLRTYPKSNPLLLEATTMTHSTQFLPPFYLSEKSIWCDFNSQEEHFLLLSDSKLTTSIFPSPFALVAAASQRRSCLECKRFFERSRVCFTHWDKNHQTLSEMNEVGQSFCSLMVMMQWLLVW